MDKVDVAYLLALHSIEGLGPMRLKSLLDRFTDPKIIWEMDIKEIKAAGIPENVVLKLQEKRKTLDPEKYWQQIEQSGIKVMTIFDEDYPKNLKEIYDPPIVFYYKGEFTPSDSRAIAVVGTRKITGYGKLVTEKFTRELSAAGFTVVSGLARGVDSAAHWAAIENGRTIAVLGGGLNQIYPPENLRLAEQIIWGKGVVMSEFPPDYASMPGNFPARNRIISGLSLATLVTEAATDSGSLITARLALEQGRDVFAVPGPITSDLSKGPADLIKEGAKLVFEVEDILEELGVNKIDSAKLKIDNLGELSENETKILEVLQNEQRHIDEICRMLNLNAAATSGTLLKMEISGLVRNLGGGVYCANIKIDG